LPLLVSWDFNVNPLCVNIAQYENNSIFIIDEIHLSNSDTRQAIDQVIAKYDHVNNFIVFGDASARAHGTRDKTTDMDIILSGLKKSGKNYSNHINISNPSIRNTANLVNGLLKPYNAEPKLYINSNCKYIIKDFLNVTGNKVQDENQGFGHHADGIRYLCNKIYGEKFFKRAV
jgi:predicted nucleotidyltransferase